MKIQIGVLALALGMTLFGPNARGECRVPSLPGQWVIAHDAVKKTQGPSGTVYDYVDEDGEVIASAKRRSFPWGSHVDISDCNGTRLGSLLERFDRTLFQVKATYSVLDAAGTTVADSEEIGLTSVSLTLSRATNPVAKIHRPWFGLLSDTWTVTVHDASVVDPRVVLMLGVFRAEVDEERRASSLSLRAARRAGRQPSAQHAR